MLRRRRRRRRRRLSGPKSLQSFKNLVQRACARSMRTVTLCSDRPRDNGRPGRRGATVGRYRRECSRGEGTSFCGRRLMKYTYIYILRRAVARAEMDTWRERERERESKYTARSFRLRRVVCLVFRRRRDGITRRLRNNIIIFMCARARVLLYPTQVRGRRDRIAPVVSVW